MLIKGLNRCVTYSQLIHEDFNLENGKSILNGLRDILAAIPVSEITLAIDYELKLRKYSN